MFLVKSVKCTILGIKNINETNKNPPRYGRNKSKTLSFSAVHLSGHQGPVI